MEGMIRPCFLVVDREFAGSISTRKLVIETAKFNVITAYSAREAVETVERFPALDGAVIDAGIPDMPCSELVKTLRRLQPKLKVVVIDGPEAPACAGADETLRSFEPQ